VVWRTWCSTECAADELAVMICTREAVIQCTHVMTDEAEGAAEHIEHVCSTAVCENGSSCVTEAAQWLARNMPHMSSSAVHSKRQHTVNVACYSCTNGSAQ